MAELQPGDIFAGHRIEGVAGRGGFGVVYRATHLALDHVVAIKVITTGRTGDETFRERFRSESRIAVSIRHPNVVAVHNAGEEDGLLFVTMDFIEGTDLRGLLNRHGRLEPKRAIPIVTQVADALDAAHEKGLVHRDIKPGNVLIEERKGREHVYLTDFGLTKQMDATSGVTASGAFVGTLDYVAPEQIKGDRLDARTDVYALGCVVFELIAGHVPFASQEEKVAKIYAHLQEEPPELNDVAPEAPRSLSEVVWRAMSKEPDARHPSAGDFARAAQAAVEGRQPTEPERNVGVGAAAPTQAYDALAVAAAGAAAAEALDPGTTADVPAPGDPEATVAAPPPGAPTTEDVPAPSAPGETVATPPPGPGTTADVPVPGDPGATVATPPPAAPGTGETVVTPPGEEPSTQPEAPAPGAPRPAEEGGRRKISGRTALLGLLGAAVIAGGAYAVLGGGGEEAAGPNGGRSNGANNGGGGSGEPKIVGDPIDVAAEPVGVAADGTNVWVSSRAGTQLQRVDAASGQPEGEPISLAGEGEQVAIDDDGNAWVSVGTSETTAGTVERFTPDGAPDASFPVGVEPRGIAIGEKFVWAANINSDNVSGISLADGSMQTVETGPGSAPARVEEGEGAIWVSNSGTQTITKITGGGETAETLEGVGDDPRGMAAAEGKLFIADGASERVIAMDVESGKVEELGDVPGEARSIAFGFGSLWVTSEGGLTRMNTDGSSAEQIGDIAQPEGVAVDDKSVWVSSGGDATLIRIDPGA